MVSGLYTAWDTAPTTPKDDGIIAGVLFTVPAYRHLVSDSSGHLVIPFWIVL